MYPNALSLPLLCSALATVVGTSMVLGAAPQGGEEAAESKTLQNPIPFTSESIQQGRKHYLRYCQSCHGVDGRALDNIDFQAADLTAPDLWRYGRSDGEIFVTTRDGAGEDMPPFRARLNEQQIWQLVNYIRSIGPEDARPPLVEDP